MEPAPRKQLRSLGKTIAERVEWDRRIHWNESGSETLDEFLEAVRPSEVSSFECEWIQVENVTKDSPGCDTDEKCGVLFNREPYTETLNKMESIIDQRGRVTAAEKRACVDSLIEIAKERGEKVGKWMLFIRPDQLDEKWEKIARATALGHLGCSSKISPGQTGYKLCCIYVKDWADRIEVKRVLDALKYLGFIVKAGFKPDFFTALGIETKNKWRLPPVIYTVQEVMQW
jgi:Domain of unknown function (DUF1917)